MKLSTYVMSLLCLSLLLSLEVNSNDANKELYLSCDVSESNVSTHAFNTVYFKIEPESLNVLPIQAFEEKAVSENAYGKELFLKGWGKVLQVRSSEIKKRVARKNQVFYAFHQQGAYQSIQKIKSLRGDNADHYFVFSLFQKDLKKAINEKRYGIGEEVDATLIIAKNFLDTEENFKTNCVLSPML